MIIFLYGEDTFRSRAKLNELKNKYIADVDAKGQSIIAINGEKADISEIVEAAAAPSLFVRKRLVIIENILNNKALHAQLLELLEKISKQEEKTAGKDDNIIIFYDETGGQKPERNKLFNFLCKQKFVQQFKPFSNTETTNWIKQEVARRGGNISLRSANALAGLVGNDLWQISNDIDKLINYRKAQSRQLAEGQEAVEINNDDVAAMVRGKFDENIFALTDAISQKNKVAAIKLLEEELDNGLAGVYLIHMITRQFRILMQVKEATSLGQSARKIANELKLHPFVVQKSVNQARNFSLEFLKSVFSYLIQLDRRQKTGQGDLRADLALMIAKI